MKKNLILTALLAMSLTAGAQNYDVNRDGRVNKDDVTDLANYIMSPMSVNPPQNVVAVDLGLPSGTKWANMNVGATSPEDYGLFFAWGETTGYTSDTSDGHSFDWESYKWGSGSQKLTKYCDKSSYGTVDNKITLDPEDDAAHMKWGGSWYMPTYDEMGELFNYTNYEWVTVNGVNGCKFTGSNGNSIFLPAAGDRYYSSLRSQGVYGYYWLSSLYTVTPNQASAFYFDSSTEAVRNRNRHIGFAVRPVLR